MIDDNQTYHGYHLEMYRLSNYNAGDQKLTTIMVQVIVSKTNNKQTEKGSDL